MVGYNYRVFPKSTVHLRIVCSTQPYILLKPFETDKRKCHLRRAETLFSLSSRLHGDKHILQLLHIDIV